MKRFPLLKKFPLLTVGSVLTCGLLVALLMPSDDVAAGIAGTDHDLSAKGWGSTQICIFCHTPHNSMTTVSDAPLWNHDVTQATFSTYSSPTLNATVGQPGGTSKLCLSCHDGTVAIDSFGGNNGTHMMGGGAKIGNNLSNDHPISFVYDAALASADGGLFTPNSTSYVDAAKKLPLFGGKLECATCHNVHDDSQGKFLRVSNASSALCLSCHNK